MSRNKSLVSIIAICAASLILMFLSSQRDAAVVDELAHIPAGYAYIKFQDYRLNPEHPPLLKALAATPLIFLNPQFPLDNPHWTNEVNGQWGVGGAFLYGVNDADRLIHLARVIPMLLTVSLIVITFLWSRRIFEDTWALLPAFLVGLSPIILAHGHYVTNDIAAALGAIIALFAFDNFIRRPVLKNVFFGGLAFGFAQLMKFSDLMLVPVFAIMTLLYAILLMARKKTEGSSAENNINKGPTKIIFGTILIFILGFVVVVYPIYALFISHYPQMKQTSDAIHLIGFIKNRVAGLDISMTRTAILRPIGQYLLGLLMTVLRVSGTNITYFNGAVSDRGNHLYFPFVYGLKESLPVLILEVGALLYGVYKGLGALFQRRPISNRLTVETTVPIVSMVIFVAAYWAASINSPLNIGVRHLIPTIPMIYILAAAAIRKWYLSKPSNIKSYVLFFALFWLTAETVLAFPYYLSYYNELGGGVRSGYRFATDSNYDWGQDMLALQKWTASHGEVDRLALDFFGASNPDYYIKNKFVAWDPSMGNPKDKGFTWFAISINNLQNNLQPTAKGFNRNTQSQYSWLGDSHPKEPGIGGVPKPDYIAGTSIFIYKL